MGTSRVKGMSGKHRPRRPVSQGRLPPGLPSLREWFERANLPLEDRQYDKLWMFHTLLREKNAEYDLTRIHQFDNIVVEARIPASATGRINLTPLSQLASPDLASPEPWGPDSNRDR